MTALKLSFSVESFFCLVLLAASTFATGATIRVPDDKPTIQAAISAATKGDTVLVAPGTYYENLVIDTKEITLTSEQGSARTILDGGTNGTILTISNTPSLATTINGFTMQGGKNSNEFIAGGIYILKGGATITDMVFGANYGGQIYLDQASALISSNTISSSPIKQTPICNSGWDVIKILGLPAIVDSKGRGVATRILNNLIEGDGKCAGLAIRGNGGDLEISNNIIRNSIYGISVYPTGLIVRQNLIYGNRFGAMFVGRDGPASTNPAELVNPADFFITSNTIVNNAIESNSGTLGSITLNGNIAKIGFINNLLITNGPYPLFYCIPSYKEYTPPILDHNDIYNGSGPTMAPNCMNPLGVNGNISVSPGLVSATDLHLAPGSPAIDAGNNSAPNPLTADLDNRPRIQDASGNGFAAVDMGAYESAGVENTTPTVLSLTSSAYYLSPGKITLTASFSPAASSSRPVSFYQDGKLIDSAVLSPASTTTTDVTLSKPGLYRFVAELDGTAGYSPATSVVLYVYVASPAPLPTSTTFSATPNPVASGQPLTLTSAVNSSGAGATPTGSITFYDGKTPLGSVSVDVNGNAAFTTSTLSNGSHLLHATYNGDATYNASTSQDIPVTVQLLPTTTTLTVSPMPVVAGQPLTATVRVDPQQATTGLCACSVTLSIAGLPPNVAPTYTLPIHNGSATFNFGLGFGAGSYTFIASFPGTASYTPSTSAPVSLTVDRAPMIITLTGAPNPALLQQNIAFAAIVKAPLSVAVPPGTISFFDGSTLIGTMPYGATGLVPVTSLTNTATVNLSTSTLSAGTHLITASYPGSTSYLPAVSAPLQLTVSSSDFTVATSTPAIGIKTEYHLAMQVTLTSLGAFSDNLSLTCDNLPAHASCTFEPNKLRLLPNGSANVKLIVDTDDVPRFRTALSDPLHSQNQPTSLALLFPSGLLAMALFRKKRKLPRLLAFFIATLPLLISLTGCGSLYPKSTAPGTYPITVRVTGANSNLSRTASITLNVTQ